MRPTIDHGNGFTLIDVTVSLALLMMIFLLLFGSLRTANRSFVMAEDRIAGNDELRLAGYFIRRQIAQMTPIFWIYQKKVGSCFRGNLICCALYRVCRLIKVVAVYMLLH